MSERGVRRWGACVVLVAVAGGVVGVTGLDADDLFDGASPAAVDGTGDSRELQTPRSDAYVITPAMLRRITEAAPLPPALPVLSSALQAAALQVPALRSAVRPVPAPAPAPVSARRTAGSAVASPPPSAGTSSYVLALALAKPAASTSPAPASGVTTATTATTEATEATSAGPATGTTANVVDVAARTTTAPTAAAALAGRFRAFAAGRPGHVSVAMYDAVAGTTVAWTDPAVAGYEMASTVKLDILTALVARAGASGQLTARERALARTMISVSDNAAASALWSDLGRGPAMQAFYRRLGMGSSTAGSGGTWGLTRTTATDQLAVLKTVAYHNGVVSDAGRAVIAGLLRTVVPSQRWGLTGGVPAGVTVDLKNGWLPRSTGGWVIASLAHVHGAGRDYVMAVYTKNGPSMSSGITTVAGLSALAWSAAKVSPAAR